MASLGPNELGRHGATNNEAGWNALIARLRDVPVAAIGLEPSGGYERGVIRALQPGACSR